MRLTIRHIIPVLIALAGTSAADAQKPSIKASIDSAYIIMGKQTQLHVQIVNDAADNGGIVMIDSMWTDVEINRYEDADTTDLGNGRREILQNIIIQSFDSGLYTLPPVLYVSESGETIMSNRPVLKVVPVPVDTMLTVHDYADAMRGEQKFFDFLPDFVTDYGLWVLLAIIAIAAGILIYYKWIRKGTLPLIPAKKPTPPYELAIQRLQQLREEKLCEKGQEKEYYTRLTDILRTYLDTRFGINAMEMTSTQILHALTKNEETRVPKKYMSQILEIADFVKFAKVRPLPDDNVQAFRSAVQFVEDTKPAPEPDEEENKKSDDPNGPENNNKKG